MAVELAARGAPRRPRTLRGTVGRGWPYLLLAVPFLIGIAALRGLTVALAIFHGSDERVYHYPTILRFSHQLPLPHLHSYPAAQTPLFHLLMAYVGKGIGYELWRLRLVEALISYLLAVAVYVLLHRRLGLRRVEATILTLLLVISPYVLGASFRLETDNLALLFSVLALERLERFRATGRRAPFLLACACIAAAILTRQSTGFLPAVAALYVLRPGAPLALRERAAGVAAAALSALPAGLLFLDWHGLVPVGSDPSSCGLCSATGPHASAGSTGLEVPTAELALATIGLYGAILFAPSLAGALRRGPRRRAAAGAAAAGLALVAVFPATPGPHAAGDLWRIAAHLPRLGGSSLLFWVLVPVAGVVLWARLAAAPSPWLPGTLALAFVVSAVVIRYPWQKYVDPFALLILLTTARPAELSSPAALTGVAILTAAFLAYVLDTGAHQSTALALAPLASTRLSASRSSWLGRQRAAAALARTCSGRVAPAITEATAGRASSAPMATSTSASPRSAA